MKIRVLEVLKAVNQVELTQVEEVVQIQAVGTKVVEIKVMETKVPRANALKMGVTTSIQKPLRDPQEQL